jgi:hypothetical protein
MRNMFHRLTHMVSCGEATRLRSQGEERRLSLSESVKLRFHLPVCEACSRFEAQLRLMREALGRYRR